MKRLSALVAIISMSTLAQVLPPNGVAPTGSPYVTLAQESIGDTSFFVDNTNAAANDGNSCTSPAAPCKTPAGACAKLPKRIVGGVNIYVDGGIYPNGLCFLEGFTMESNKTDGGAYINFVGFPPLAPDAGNGTIVTGTVTSATALTNTVWGTVTVTNPGNGGWPDGGLRGYLFRDVTQANETVAIYDNTLNVITTAGLWPVATPQAGDTFQLLDPCAAGGTIIDGGIPASSYLPSTGIGGLGVGYVGGTASILNWTAFGAFNNHSAPSALPAMNSTGYLSGFNHTLIGGGIYVQGMCFASLAGSAALVRNSPGVVFNANKVLNLTPTTLALVDTDSNSTQITNNYFRAVSGQYSAVSVPLNVGGVPSVLMVGNVGDSVNAFQDDVGDTNTQGYSPVRISAQANSWRSSPVDGYWASSCVACDFQQEIIEGAAQYCYRFAPAAATDTGSFGSGLIVGGRYQGCSGGGMLFQGPQVWRIGSASNPATGTSGSIGITLDNGARVMLRNTGSSALTGSSGDFSIDRGATFDSYTNLGTYGRLTDVLTGTSLINNDSAGNVGKTRSGGFTDSSGTPGAATINQRCGRSAIASGNSSAAITNNLVVAASMVKCQLETAAAGVAAVTCNPGSGSFTATSVNGTGVATNATSNAKFNWCVEN